MNKIIDLQETSPNYWKAKYRGNYGTYIIKIETDGEKRGNFSCSCPSSYFPCKHIPIVEKAIAERISKSKKENRKELFEGVVRKLTLQHLQEFVIRFGLHNPSFQQAVLLEFTPQQKQSDSNQYAAIIQSGLEEAYIDVEDIYDYDYGCFEIDVLEQWIGKAREYMEQGRYSEAILIAKACIEEYAAWLKEADSEVDDYISEEYTYAPFNILKEAYNGGYLSAKSLLAYCKKELENGKYRRAFRNMFKELIMQLTKETDPEAYLTMQDTLFNALPDKTSYEAKTILDRKIDFYKRQGDETTAWKIVEENVQIEAFRKQVVEKRIAENKLKEAKKIINDYISQKTEEVDYAFFGNEYSTCWDEYLLTIAQKENDTKSIREISRRFINDRFHSEYYKIYKSTFPTETWNKEVEALIKHYHKGRNWTLPSVADILAEEEQTERLLRYLSKEVRINFIVQYCKYISPKFPEETLALFKQAIDTSMRNTGREIYEDAVEHFGSMLEIKGGTEVVKQMIDGYEKQYKNRKAMVEIFARFRKSRL